MANSSEEEVWALVESFVARTLPAGEARLIRACGTPESRSRCSASGAAEGLQQFARWRQTFRRLDDLHHVQQISQHQLALAPANARARRILPERCLNPAGSRPAATRAEAGRRPTRMRALDDIMKPVPAGNASQLTALPVEHRPGAGGRDLDVPRRKIPMVQGRLEGFARAVARRLTGNRPFA